MNSIKSGTRLLIVFFTVSIFVAAQIGKKAEYNLSEAHVIDKEQLIMDMKILSSDKMRGRETGTDGGKQARKYVVKRFKESGIKELAGQYTQEFSFKTTGGKTINGVNVLGSIAGVKNPERYIIITAHYDHIGVRQGEIYNGADDNASGTAALFAFAAYFKKNPPENSIILVALDAEEKGLTGAKYFVRNLPVKKKDILLNINLDMVSRSDKNELYAAGTYHYPFLKAPLAAVQKKSALKLLLGHDRPELKGNDWTYQSDHAVFHREKIPFIYFGVEDHKDYHKPSDTFENINMQFYMNAVKTILMAIESIDQNYKKCE